MYLFSVSEKIVAKLKVDYYMLLLPHFVQKQSAKLPVHHFNPLPHNDDF